MTAEIDIAGIFFSPLLVCLVAAFVLRQGLSWVFNRTRFSQQVWNRPLFDLSLLLLLVGLIFEVFQNFPAS